MRKIALFALASLVAVAALPANATLANRKSDEPRSEQAQPAPYSGQTVTRGEIQDREIKDRPAQPAPYSGQVVKRGLVRSHTAS